MEKKITKYGSLLLILFSVFIFLSYVNPLKTADAQLQYCNGSIYPDVGAAVITDLGETRPCVAGSCGNMWCKTGEQRCQATSFVCNQTGWSAVTNCTTTTVPTACDTSTCSAPTGSPLMCPDTGGGGGGGGPTSSNFSLSVSPSIRSIFNGESTSFVLTINPANTAAVGTYTLPNPIPGCPAGATCTYSGGNTMTVTQDTTSGGVDFAVPANKTVNVSASSVAGNTYTFNFSATNGSSQSQSASASLFVASGVNNASCVSITGPDTLSPGQQFQLNVTMRNTGTKTWAYPSPGVGHRLASWNPNDVDIWGPWTARIDMGAGVTVPSNGQITFTRMLIAPTTPGNYNFQFAMVDEGVEWIVGPGAICAKPGGITVVATPPAPVNNSQCLAFDLIDTSGNVIVNNLTPGQSFSSRVSLRNTGNTSWTPFANSAPDATSLAISPWAPTPWNYSRGLFSSAVLPNGTTVITTPMTAPAAGTYSMSYRLYKESGAGGAGWFGATCTKSNIVVASPPTVTMTPSATSVTVGQSVVFTITASASAGLSSLGIEAYNSSGVATANLEEPSVSGTSATRNLTWTAPAPGTYHFGGFAWTTGRAALVRTSPPITVIVSAAPTVSLSAPSTATVNTAFTVNWTSTNAASVVNTSSVMPPAGCTMSPTSTSFGVNDSRTVTCSTTGPKYFQITVWNSLMVQAVTGRTVSVANNQYTLMVNKTIGGDVTSVSPDGRISCGSICSAQYDQGDVVTLQARSNTAQWRFVGWGGACAGTAVTSNCVVTVDSAKTVTAQFRPRALLYQEF
ncbi:MAG: hypothetical protein NTV02_02475 [Candidatus Zambryskibacteria bacterium]|nr:hypothetical protein [Candidatus Zambryskibacteria bacterium]